MMVVFEKSFALRHIGHLDLMRTVQRALRRSGLPIRYSNGFNPHIKLSFAAPLSVGVVGKREIMDVPLEKEISEQAFLETFNQSSPACLRASSCRLLSDEFPTLMALVAGSSYTLLLDDTPQAQKVLEALPLFMDSKEITALRKTKSGENMCNIRPFVLTAKKGEEGGQPCIRCVIEQNASGALKPALLMDALCELADIPRVPCLAIRENILSKAKDGSLAPMQSDALAGEQHA